MKKLFAFLILGLTTLFLILFSGDNSGEDAKCIADKWKNIKKKK